MSKAPVKRRHMEMEYKIAKEWRTLASAADNFAHLLFESILSFYKNVAAGKIREIAEAENRFKCDEKIFDYYSKLIGYYEEAVSVRIPSENRLHDTVERLNSALNLRIRKFYESKSMFLSNSGDLNPIALEKNEILSKHLRMNSQNLDACFAKFISAKRRDCLICTRKHILKKNSGIDDLKAACAGLLEIFNNNALGSLSKNCLDSAHFAVMFLNDLKKRKTTEQYFWLLMDERNYLSSSVMPAIASVENMLYASKPSNTAEHRAGGDAGTNAYISILKEAYQFIAMEADEVEAGFRQMSKISPHHAASASYGIREFSLFLEKPQNSDSVMENMYYDGFLGIYNELYDKFLKIAENAVTQYADSETGEKNTRRFIFDMGRIAFLQESLAKELAAVFSDAADSIPDAGLIEGAEQIDIDILNGIKETVSIKKDCISDGLESFKFDAESLIATFSGESHKIPESDLSERALEAAEIIKESLIQVFDDERHIAQCIKKVMGDYFNAEEFKNMTEKAIKKKKQRLDKLNGLCRKFNKENLLYEISTFEEIINHSVSRLMNSQSAPVKEIAELITDKFKDIEKILKKHEIYPIRPNPHDMFNAKEHEVMMAEKNTEFKKGEIIKLMNSGYKSGEFILLRANVIAAK